MIFEHFKQMKKEVTRDVKKRNKERHEEDL